MGIAATFGNCKSWFFCTDTGAPQGDCASASEFAFYLAKSPETTIANDTSSLEERNTFQSNLIVPQNYQIDIDKQYSDNSKISISNSALEKMKNEPLVKLAQRGLKINEAKSEKCTIKRVHWDNRRRDCKLFGSLRDTQNDIKRRRVLAMNASNKPEIPVFKQRCHHQCENKTIQILYSTNISIYFRIIDTNKQHAK